MVGTKHVMAGMVGLAVLAGCGTRVAPAPVSAPITVSGGTANAEGFFDPDPTWAQSQIAQEFKAQGVNFHPKVVIDWTSYVDDDSQVIHLSRFKFSNAFRKLAQKAMYDTTFIHLVRHETAHAFFNAKFHQDLNQQFTDTFGPIDTPYDIKLVDQALANMRYQDRPEFVSKYAQLHPAEDFAETLAVYLQKQGNPDKLAKFMSANHKNAGLKRKFDYVAAFFKSLRAHYPGSQPTPPAPAPATDN